MMNWQEITSDLYSKIKPITGYLGSMVEEQSAKEKRFSSLNIWFEMNEFVYVDPFYGEQKSTDPFNMFLELTSLPDLQKIELISQLENLQIKNDNSLRIGAFSNSLHFTVPSLGFGNIENNTIEFEMEYCLTNSDSYGYMDGEIQDHIKHHGNIKVLLKIKEVIALQYNARPLNNVLKYLNAQVYDTSKAYEALDTNISMKDRTQYYIPYRNIMAT